MAAAHDTPSAALDSSSGAELLPLRHTSATMKATGTSRPSCCANAPSASSTSLGDPARFGVLTVSDRASAGVYDDLSGPAILGFFGEAVASPWEAVYRVVADEQPLIEAALKDMVDREGCCLVVTTGGTGPAPRDVTPEATEAVCSRMMPGYGEQMRAISLRYVPTAVLSRQTAGIRGTALIINLPGKPKSIRETFDEVFKSIPYCLQLLGGPYVETVPAVVAAFRPPNERRTAKPLEQQQAQ
ncbi:Molybdopterin adenylyltransferase [Tetrabaena socialis]|uniref:molybdopterin molybdotransferase n=1 Tax=Tetrabaena socialis TaxID=47790 RepID=A0A2J7ZMM3_9CHLO|nr:Molybdopterin adenylyltransferase [Tetrabaena socialis]|eukprot:PNH01522.1 Molybdopterin adenylyltransferase [Tetrabaena socialis]